MQLGHHILRIRNDENFKPALPLRSLRLSPEIADACMNAQTVLYERVRSMDIPCLN
jgi:hypothetical protein